MHPELLAIATGAGSLIFSHVNDGGFWLVKEYFNMSVGRYDEELVDLRDDYFGGGVGADVGVGISGLRFALVFLKDS